MVSFVEILSDLFVTRRRHRNITSWTHVNLKVLLFLPVLVLLWSQNASASPLPQPSSAWNQPALAINTINPSHEAKKNMIGHHNGGGSGSTTSGGKSSSPPSQNGHHNSNNGHNNELQRKKTYTWNTIMHYGLAGGSDHNIRHKAKKLRDHGKLPCPFDQIRSWFDGKCRPAPRFSLYRVG